MTLTTLKYLMWFLNAYSDEIKPEARIADYGGIDNPDTVIFPQVVKKSLAGAGRLNYHALDFDSGVDLRKPLRGPKYDVGICMDLLEHCSDPFLVAHNIRDSLRHNALLFVTAPFIWDPHFFPKDYWRFTPQGIEELFSAEGDPKAMDVLALGTVRDPNKGEFLQLCRVVAVFRKAKKKDRKRDDAARSIFPPEWGVRGFDKTTFGMVP